MGLTDEGKKVMQRSFDKLISGSIELLVKNGYNISKVPNYWGGCISGIRTQSPIITNGDFSGFTSVGWTNRPQPQVTNFLIPNFIGVKKNEITLIWGKGDEKEITKAVRSDGDVHSFELGFYVAYYKRVHKDWKPEVLRNKIVEIFKLFEEPKEDEPIQRSNLICYFNCIFIDNCGLDNETAKRFIKYITKRQDQETIVIPENFIFKTEVPK